MSTVTPSRPVAPKPDAGVRPTTSGHASTSASGTLGHSAAGHTRITARALNRLMEAVAAEALGVAARSVSVDLADDAGRLAVTVRSPLRVVSLAQVTREPGIVARTGGTLLDRATAAQQRIRSLGASLSGSDISTVTVRLTGIDIQPEGRTS
ncbi:hypothetical protein B7R21_17675 [Subtercola boreus]|uniref:Uncharacterized protein n=1 Tax=Subtercola boreus TaxID=120213 RepID=A0A3E0VAV4_9MICO|nr:hypothetical protein [Subtercola boreus]RFA06944.1 hypothetical protein B7R21_17675 [Subtercola boreus]